MSAVAVVLRASHTHLYPGARLHGSGITLRRGRQIEIEFSDLGHARARVEAAAGARATLAVSAHRTARGTSVAAKRWQLERQPGDDGWRVLRRSADD
ncbi:MAG: hypothetical protein U1F07_15610 [Rubrivivax sp.]